MKKIYALFLICFSVLIVYGQDEANHWYFGEFAGLSFQSGNPVAQTDGVLDTWEGCSAISTSSGTLRFYTDGIRVYNRNHQIMPNGNGLLGDPSSSQSGIIVPHPGNNQQYYIFSIDNEDPSGGINGLNYSLVNMNLDNWLGDVVSTEKNVNLTAPLCEKVTAVGHSNGVDTWVITHKWGTNDFYVYKVTTDGVELTPVISSAGIVVGGPGTSQHDPKGYMKVSPDGSTIAKANAGLRSVEIFDFDNTTGVVNNAIIDNSLGGEPYGVEFSPNNNFLYINTWKTKPSRVLYQYDLKDDDVIGSRVQIASGANGALQLAPDNRIYVAMAQTGYLSRINQPNKAGSACNYQASAVYLDGRQSMWGLPPFVQSFFTFNASFFNDPPCYGYPTQFYENSSQSPDSLLWDFDDPASGSNNTSTEPNPTHEFTTTSNYIVKLTVWIEGFEDAASRFLVVTMPPEPDLGEDTFFCEGDTHILDAGDGYAEYLWSTGATTQTIGVQTADSYWCIVHSEEGCSGSDTIVLNAFPKPEVDLGPDMEFCEGTLHELNAGPGYESYLWSTGDTTQTLVVQTTNNYWVDVYNSYGCPKRDSVLLTFHEKPLADAGETQTIDQGETTTLDGSASGGSGNYTYSWEPSDLLVQSDVLDPQTLAIIEPTIFTLTVTDDYGCVSLSDDVLINLYGSTLAAFPFAEPDEFCLGESTTISANASGGGGDYTYSWTSTPSGFTSNLSNFNDFPLADTRYNLYLVDQFGNEFDSFIDVTVIQTDPIDLVPEYIPLYGQDTIVVCVRDSVILDSGTDEDPETTTYFWTRANLLNRYYKASTNGNWIDIQTHEVVVNYGGETNCERHGIITIIFDYNLCEIGIPETFVNDDIIDLYPNPNNGSFTLSMNEDITHLNVNIYDIRGNLIADHILTGNYPKGHKQSFQLELQEKGIYIVYLGSDTFYLVKKMIIK